MGGMAPDLTKVTEIFLVPSSFLVAALGTADTNPHRAAVSLVGFAVSVLWLICSRESLGGSESPRSKRTHILSLHLPLIFVVGWLLSFVVHVWLWNTAL